MSCHALPQVFENQRKISPFNSIIKVIVLRIHANLLQARTFCLEYLFVSPVKMFQCLNKSREEMQELLTSVVTLRNNMWIVKRNF
jgi:hypothetical protein